LDDPGPDCNYEDSTNHPDEAIDSSLKNRLHRIRIFADSDIKVSGGRFF